MDYVPRLALLFVLAATCWLMPLGTPSRHPRRDLRRWAAERSGFSDSARVWRQDSRWLLVDRVRVVLVDGLAAANARQLPAWRAVCDRGLTLAVDVGFPTVSLPVEVALWTGLTQQQSGVVFRSDHPLVPPLADGIPANVPGSRAIAEDHGWIVRSLGFADVRPPADPSDPSKVKDAEPAAWRAVWLSRAHDAVASDARLAFVHVLRVDTMGHRVGRASPAYAATAGDADAIVDTLVAAAPDARWFLLSDHGHLDDGGHGGEERELRVVQACIAGPGVARGNGGPIHIVDVARALADSLGVKLDPHALGRPLGESLAAPLDGDQAVPALPLRTAAIAILLIIVGGATSYAAARRWWLLPWWFVIACVSLVLVRGLPTLSMAMVYAPAGRAMYITWLPALAVCAIASYAGTRDVRAWRVAVAQLALPVATLAAVITACGAWRTLLGAAIAPVVAHYTAWLSALLLIMAHGSAAVALGVLGRLARSGFGRRAPPETPRSAPASA